MKMKIDIYDCGCISVNESSYYMRCTYHDMKDEPCGEDTDFVTTIEIDYDNSMKILNSRARIPQDSSQ